MVLSQKLAGSESDVTIRSGSPALSDSFGKDLSGVALLGGSTGASQLGGGRGIEAEPYISDRKHMPDRSHWGLLGSNNAVGSPAADAIGVWAQANALEGTPAAGLLSQQDDSRDTELDAPMSNLQLQAAAAAAHGEGLVGSWPGAAGHHHGHSASTTDAALPFFQGRPIRTGSHLSNMAAGVQRTSSFNGHPGSARAMGGHVSDGGFAGADQLCFGSCNSAPITPRSQAFTPRSPSLGFGDEDTGVGLPHVNSAGPGHIRGYADGRHGPSKLRMSSSDHSSNMPASAALAAAGMQGISGLDAFPLGGVATTCGTPDHMAAANMQMLLQQQQAALQMAQSGMLPGAAGLPPQQAAAMAQAAALMAGMNPADAGMQAAAAGLPGYNMMPPMMPDAAAAGVGGMNQMQMLMYYAQLGMMAQMNNAGGGMGMPGVPAAGGLPNMPGMANPMMFSMMNPQQMAAFCASAQQQWQAGMPATAIANIAAAAAVAATAATNQDEPGSGNRNAGRGGPRQHPLADLKTDRRLRCDRSGGGRSSGGRCDDGGMGSPSVGGRLDPLLEEYKNNRTRRWEMRDILGHMMEFSLDQLGSRFIQQKLDTLSPEELEAAFAEVAPKGLMLMNDVFGNYVIQKFLELDVPSHRAELAAQMKGQVLSLSLQLYSCRVIQKALEVLPLEQKIGIVAELDGALMRCVRDQNGNHVIQKVIECVPTEHITNLLDTFAGNLVSLSQHPFGCRVMQRILEHCADPGRYNVFMTEILKATVQLGQDQYGNYVIQHVVEQGKPHERDAVYERLFPHIVVLSQNKFASNVVEKMLLHCTPAQRGAIVEEFLRQPSRRSSSDGVVSASYPGLGCELLGCEQSALEQMMQDQYGNYVVQKTLEVCDEGQRERLLSRVRCYYETLKSSQFGKHIVNRLEKLLSAGMRIQVNSLNNMALHNSSLNSSNIPAAAAPADVPAAAPVPAAVVPAALQQQQPAAADAAAAAAEPAAAAAQVQQQS
ncbi:hypothetical protein OEZ85_005532 [Tetradesmus obliquus]|uniref:PUM-HD domain-containing protein n=1 Tax=Tetradesmus obliquus TaxID=3088 RepID=A0ABY8UIZ6_TETOB|nr:hypothetical protein OEZ85_005532 [Tetradesmus obliquus]